MAIERLNQGTPTVASQIPYYDPDNGRDARMSVTDLANLLAGQQSGTGFVKQFAAPNASAYTINVNPAVQGSPTWLIVTPLGAYAAMSIVLPVGVDGQEVLVNCTQAVTALTVTGALVGIAAQPVNGAPTTLAANGFFRLRFESVSGSWYRVG